MKHTERYDAQRTPRSHPSSDARTDASHPRKAFHKPHTSLGAAGHWIRTAALLSPLLIGEIVKDPEKRWRYIRIASIATTLATEAMWSHKVSEERKEAKERELEHC